MFTCVKFTSKISWSYAGVECPKRFSVRAGRASGVYGTEVFTPNGHVREMNVEALDYDGLGVYYVRVFAIDKNDNAVGGDEFEMTLTDPNDAVIAPSTIRIVNNE